MKYFSIQHSLNESIMGKLPQLKEVKHNCNVLTDPNFVDRFPFKKIETHPILSNPILYAKAKKTDLIHAGGLFSFDDNAQPLNNYLGFAWEGLEVYGQEAGYITQQEYNNYVSLSQTVHNDEHSNNCDN